jgi:hypothetical protein
MNKHLLSLLIICSITASVLAQNCSQFIYMTNGKVVTYSSANGKGKATSKMVYTVSKKAGNKATVQSSIFDDKGKQISSADAQMICEGSNLKIDMRNFMPAGQGSQFKNMTAKADVSYLIYPTKLRAGQQLDDGNFTMQMYNKEQKMSDISMRIFNRKVESTETITTPAGTYDCFKFTYNAEMKTTTFGISIPLNMQITEWYSAKLGLYVKSEAVNKNGKLLSVTSLESVN